MASLDINQLTPEQVRQLQGSLSPRWNKYIPGTPTAKQTAALLMDVKELLYGGAA